MSVASRRGLAVLAVVLFINSVALAQSESTPLAIVNGAPVTEDDVREIAASELDALKAKKRQFETTTRGEEYDILQTALDGLIAERLLTAEAAKRGISQEELLNLEVDQKKAAPTEAEIQNIYNMNAQRLNNAPLESVRSQIVTFLDEQKFDEALDSFVASLRTEYGVESMLEPFRVAVETEGHPFRGPDEAQVTIVEFSDFECPFCRRALPAFDQIKEEYGDRIRLVFRQFPLNNIHPRAQKAAEASLCAMDQGEFWTMHDLLFSEPVELEPASLKAKAATLELDTITFNACLDSSKYAARVASDIRDGTAAGVTGTPTLFINGRAITGAQPFETYQEIIEDELRRNPR